MFGYDFLKSLADFHLLSEDRIYVYGFYYLNRAIFEFKTDMIVD